MPSNQPVIKFSPFEALLIGEKNSILKRQPMKNAIFVSRLNHPNKKINLRALFGLDKNESKKNDTIFKVPQRMQDYLKNRKKENKENKNIGNKKEILLYEFEGQNINETSNSKRKKTKCKANFKRKRKKKEKYRNRAVRKFPKPNRNDCVKEVLKKKCNQKTKAKKKCEKTKSPKQKLVASYVLYLKEDRRPLSDVQENEQMCKYEKAEPAVPNVKFDTIVPNAVSNKQNPQIPKNPEVFNFEDDSNLLDIIYENFPKIVKFECKSFTDDFSEALMKADLVKPKTLRMYKKNGIVKNDLVKILSNPFPLVRCQRVNNIMPNECIVIGRCAPEINEPYLKKNHFFFNGKKEDALGGDSKPKRFVQNSCLRSLQ